MPADHPSAAPGGGSSNRRNAIVFGLLCIFVVAGITIFTVHARHNLRQNEETATAAEPASHSELKTICQQPYIMFRNTALGPDYGKLAVAPLDAPDGRRYPTSLTCERVYGTADSGMCLQAIREAFPIYQAVSFNSQFQVTHIFNLPGAPSRTRVSPDGRLAAATVFIAGQGYSGVGFSTRTSIYDLGSGATLAGDLETFSVIKDGQPFKRADFNFWGVTWASDGDVFYATLASGGIFYLVKGSLAQREMSVMRPGVECPSLSPDGGQIVFKSRSSDEHGVLWHLHVLDLKTGTERAVNESRSVDDQAEWLDSTHVLYGLPRNVAGSGSWDIWVADLDENGTPRVFIHDAASPCVVRPGLPTARNLTSTMKPTGSATPVK